MSEAIALAKGTRNPNMIRQAAQGRSSWSENLAGMLPFLVFALGMVLYEALPRSWVAGPIGMWCYVALYIPGIIGLGVQLLVLSLAATLALGATRLRQASANPGNKEAINA